MRTKDKNVPPLHAGKISLVRLWFRYAADLEFALSGLNAEISPGAVVDLIAPNTGDNSIFLKLTKGLHQPHDSKVLFDGLEIRRHRSIGLRRAIGRLLQNFDLFYGKTRQKQLLSMPTARAENLEQAAPPPGWRAQGDHDPQRHVSCGGAKRQRLGVRRSVGTALMVLDKVIVNLDEGMLEYLLQPIFQAFTRLDANRKADAA